MEAGREFCSLLAGSGTNISPVNGQLEFQSLVGWCREERQDRLDAMEMESQNAFWHQSQQEALLLFQSGPR